MSKDDYSIENLISRKKRRKNRERMSEDLEKLFAELQSTPDDSTASPSSVNIEASAQNSEATLDVKEAVETAQKYLEPEQSDRLAQILYEDEGVVEDKNYIYFRNERKNFPPAVLPDDILTFETIPMKQIVYTTILNLSKTQLGMRQLLSSGWLYHYYKRGWNFPSSIYRWLFQIAAFEEQNDICNDAKFTLLSLWKSLSSEEHGGDYTIADSPNERCIPWQDFEQVLKMYGAVEQEISWAQLLLQDESGANNRSLSLREINLGNENNKSNSPIPIPNVRCVVQLFGQSVWHSQSSYSPSVLSYVIMLLIQMSMDPQCEEIAYDIEKAIRCCLESYNKHLWKKEVDKVASVMVSRFLDEDIQVKSLQPLKSVSERSNYFRRTLALAYLLAGATRAENTSVNLVQSSSTPNTPQSTFSEDVESSNCSTPAVQDIISVDQYPVSIELQIEPLIRSRKLAGLYSHQLDAHKLSRTVNLLSISLGDNEDELKQQRHLSKKIGGKVGSLDRTISNVREYLYKFLVVGDLGTGKTSIIKRYVHNIFSMHYKSTIGVDFALKVIQWSPEIVVRLQLWDIAGQERFGNMTRVYYKEALGAFVVYDVTRPQTFEGVRKWKADLDSKISLPEAWGGGNIPVVLLANKSDLINEGHGQHVNAAEMDTFCKENGFIKWFETSAKDNTNIDDAARHLVTSILAIEQEHLDRHDAESFENNNQQIRVDSRDKTRSDSGCC
ncbi:rab32 [Umbelopsis nana]